jgi:hypothetical protein
MTHLSDEQLVAQFYKDGDSHAVAEHLRTCEACQVRMDQLSAVLNSVDLPVPERSEEYGASVWHNLRGHLAEGQVRQPWWKLPSTLRWSTFAAVAALVLAAFLLGRFTQTPPPQIAVQHPTQSQPPAPTITKPEEELPRSNGAQPVQVKSTKTPTNVKSRDRILVVAVGDHLERSQMVLAELMNADAGEPIDISTQRQIAGELVAENRLYRQAARRDKDPSLTNLLDELERVLVDIAHEPSKLSGPELASVKQRIEAQGIVFKVRVVGSQIRQREKQKQTTLGKST